MVRIKICGVTTPDDARFAAEARGRCGRAELLPKVAAVRHAVQAAAIVRALPAFTVPFGVFVGMPLRQVCAVAFQLGLRGVQTYDDQPPDDDSFPFAHVPAFRVKDREGLDHVRRFVEAADGRSAVGPAAVLIDSHVRGADGRHRPPAPWELLAGFDPGVPLILAGGLTPENVAEAISPRTAVGRGRGERRRIRSRPERPRKVAEFVRNARRRGSLLGRISLSHVFPGLTISPVPGPAFGTPTRGIPGMSAGYWLGVDLGGTKILSGLFDDDLKLLARSKQPTSAESGPASVFGRIVQGVDAVIRRKRTSSPAQVRGMGIGIPGQIELGTTRVRFAPNLDWRDVDLKPLMPAAWQWPLVVENDVRMGTYGEFAHGAATRRAERARRLRRHRGRRRPHPQRRSLLRLQRQRRRNRPPHRPLAAWHRTGEPSPAAST